jgi:hypothetical protein
MRWQATQRMRSPRASEPAEGKHDRHPAPDALSAIAPVSQATYASISLPTHEPRIRSIVDGLTKYSSNMNNLRSL